MKCTALFQVVPVFIGTTFLLGIQVLDDLSKPPFTVLK